METKTKTEGAASWQTLLESAVSTPGVIHQAYSRFWNYSSGNQMLAMYQCAGRGIEIGPIGTFMAWKDAGRFVRKGEKAIQLCMPITMKRTATTKQADGSETEETFSFSRFTYRNNWFVLSQTDGKPYELPAMPEWSKDTALTALEITEAPFTHTDGNCQGFATGRSVAISPIAAMPHKTLFHELAHVVLGHTAEGGLTDGQFTPRNLREVEAEAVALICCESLGLAGAEYSRGYIQSWKAEIPERSAQRIFHAADQILKAGR